MNKFTRFLLLTVNSALLSTFSSQYIVCGQDSLGAIETNSVLQSASQPSSQISDLIKVVYPPQKSTIASSSTFLVGQVTANNNLTCNGKEVKVNKLGFFAHVVPLQYGTNNFILSSNNGGQSSTREIVLYRKPPAKPISIDEIKLENALPNVDQGVKPGDIIYFSVHATPSNTVAVWLDKHCINLTPMTGKSLPVQSLDVAYGKVSQQNAANKAGVPTDFYKGTYRVSAEDHFLSVHSKFELIHDAQKISITSKAKISTVENLLGATTNKTSTIVRLGPGLARTTPLVEGVKVLIDGWSGDNMRCLYSPNHHVWIKQSDLNFEKTSSEIVSEKSRPKPAGMVDSPALHTVARTINMISDEYGDQIRLPLTEKVPYQIEQKLDPNTLTLRVYGVSADTDWITSEPKANGQDISIVDHVTWRQIEDNVYDIVVHLSGKRQWGYRAFYDDTTLCLAIKRPVDLSTRAANSQLVFSSNQISKPSLAGLKICLDPGHGGKEKGSIGCSGLPESQVNLDIATKVRSCLEELGATVIMTRTTQNENPSLDNRVKIAADAQADFLISIHNNALPDGRDPWHEHGTSSYWYHPQAVELARCLKESVREASAFPDLGARYQNLALARGQAMPAVLLEIGFMINPDEFSQLIDPQFQDKIARAITSGINKYLYNSP